MFFGAEVEEIRGLAVAYWDGLFLFLSLLGYYLVVLLIQFEHHFVVGLLQVQYLLHNLTLLGSQLTILYSPFLFLHAGLGIHSRLPLCLPLPIFQLLLQSTNLPLHFKAPVSHRILLLHQRKLLLPKTQHLEGQFLFQFGQCTADIVFLSFWLAGHAGQRVRALAVLGRGRRLWAGTGLRRFTVPDWVLVLELGLVWVDGVCRGVWVEGLQIGFGLWLGAGAECRGTAVVAHGGCLVRQFKCIHQVYLLYCHSH